MGCVNSSCQRRLQQRLTGGDRHGVVLRIEGQAKTLDWRHLRTARRRYRSPCSDSFQEDRIALVDPAPLQDRSEHTGIAAMVSAEMLQQLGCCYGGVGIERDHRASRVALNNRHFQPVADFQRLPTSDNS